MTPSRRALSHVQEANDGPTKHHKLPLVQNIHQLQFMQLQARHMDPAGCVPLCRSPRYDVVIRAEDNRSDRVAVYAMALLRDTDRLRIHPAFGSRVPVLAFAWKMT